MDKLPSKHKQQSSANRQPYHQKNTTPAALPSQSHTIKKWSIGGLFRRKKKGECSDSSTSDDDRKAGFNEKPRKTKPKPKRSSNKLNDLFDHIVVAPIAQSDAVKTETEHRGFPDNHSFPFGAQTPPGSQQSTGSLDRRLRRDRIRAARIYSQEPHSSGVEAGDHQSLNSSTMSRFRSDESLTLSGGSGNRRSRSARTERYMKRISKCDDNSGSGRWKTQPIHPPSWEVLQTPPQQHTLRSSASLTHMPAKPQQHTWSIPMRPKYPDPPAPHQKSVSYEHNLHRLVPMRGPIITSQPPPPPPRDPQRRITINTTQETRPVSYAFDHNKPQDPVNFQRMAGRCVSDDKLWGPATTFHAIPQRPASVQPPTNQVPVRRFIARHDPAGTPLTNDNISTASAYRYVADTAPRSRRPIHVISSETPKPPSESAETMMLRTTKSGLSTTPSSANSAANFWKRIEQAETERAAAHQRPVLKQRSVSHSRVHSGRLYADTDTGLDATDGIVTGSLVLKPARSCFFQPQSLKPKTIPFELSSISTPFIANKEPAINKYEEHVAKNISHPPLKLYPKPPAPAPPLRTGPAKQSGSEEDIKRSVRRKSTNLEDAINELEAIYKSLHLSEDNNLLDRAERRETVSPVKPKSLLDQQLLLDAARYDEDEQDESRTNGEPDIVLDDVCYRNLKRANSIPRCVDAQPMFGIPVGPIPPSPGSDYLHVKPNPTAKPLFVAQKVPDTVTDDLAVRNLRKDSGGKVTEGEHIPTRPTLSNDSFSKKKKAIRSMSENIYNLIQRDAAKPSGGCLADYSMLERQSNNSSCTDIANNQNASDHPSTLFMLQRERKLLHGNDITPNRGAVFNLPSTLKTTSPGRPSIHTNKPPIPQPRATSYSPEPKLAENGMEDILNAIAQEAQESSAKLNRDLMELRQEIRAKTEAATQFKSAANAKLNTEIEVASSAVRDCQELLSAVVENTIEKANTPKRKNSNGENMMKDIQNVGEAARLCERMLDQVIEVKAPKRKDEKDAHDVENARGLSERKQDNVHIRSTNQNSNDLITKSTVEDKYVEIYEQQPEKKTESNSTMQITQPLNRIKNSFSQEKIDEIHVSEPQPTTNTSTSLNFETQFLKNYSQIEHAPRTTSPIVSREKPEHPITPPNNSQIEDLSQTSSPNVARAKPKLSLKSPNDDNRSGKIHSVSNLLEKLEPDSKQIGAIAERCMRQLNDLGSLHAKVVGKQSHPIASGDYDNLNSSLRPQSSSSTTYDERINTNKEDLKVKSHNERKSAVQEELDKIMAECADEADKNNQLMVQPKFEVASSSDEHNEEMNIILLPPNADTPIHPCDENTVSFSANSPVADDRSHNKSSSDGCIKSSSCTPNRAHSSSITSFNAQSSSDFVKSSSSDYHLAKTHSDDLKTNSTTSYDVKSTSTTANESSFNSSPSPPLALTPSGDDLSQYNSSEELATIFGIRDQSMPGNTSAVSTANAYTPTKIASANNEFRTAFVSLATILEEQHREVAPTVDNGEHIYSSTLSIQIGRMESSFSSMESIESIPDSGNVSLNEYPLVGGTDSGVAAAEYMFCSEVNICTKKENSVQVGGNYILLGGSVETLQNESNEGECNLLEDDEQVNSHLEILLSKKDKYELLHNTEEQSPHNQIGSSNELSTAEGTVHSLQSLFDRMTSSTDSVADEMDLPECFSSPPMSVDEHINSIFDQLLVEVDDEFFRCNTSLSLTTIHENDEIEFMRIVAEHEADEQMSNSSNSFKSIDSECGAASDIKCAIHSDVADKTPAQVEASVGPNSIKSKILSFENRLKGIKPNASTSDKESRSSKQSSSNRSPSQVSATPRSIPHPPTSSTSIQTTPLHLLEPNHMLLACTIALAATDMLTIFTVLVAIITVISIVWL